MSPIHSKNTTADSPAILSIGRSEPPRPIAQTNDLDPTEMEAALLLGRVEAMVATGRLGQAVDLVVAKAAVSRETAEEFVEGLYDNLTGMPSRRMCA